MSQDRKPQLSIERIEDIVADRLAEILIMQLEDAYLSFLNKNRRQQQKQQTENRKQKNRKNNYPK